MIFGQTHLAAPGGSGRWRTIAPSRTVLGIIHNVTSATRLLDLLAVFDGDTRIQTVFTCTGSSPFAAGIKEFITTRELPFISWDEARRLEFDLAVSTSRGGELQDISAPLIGTPHGAGYNKKLSREPGAGSREPGAGSREPGAGSREPGAFGLTAEWLLHEGELIPSAIVLSHDEQRERLRQGCPEALPIAQVIGDPCMDQLCASTAFREEYRAAFGIRPGQKLLLLTSTWGRNSLMGGAPDVVRRALAELPREEYRIVAAIHPNAFHGHGGWQIKSWLAPFIRSGLMVPTPETHTWKAALCAADLFIGDHGSVSIYASAQGIPGLLASFDEESVAAGSPMDLLGQLLPRVAAFLPLSEQLGRATREQHGDPRLAKMRGMVTSRPMEALARLRRLCYSFLKLEEPPYPAVAQPVSIPRAVSAAQSVPGEPALAVHAQVLEGRTAEVQPAVSVHRYPAGLQGSLNAHLPDVHVVAEEQEPDVRWAHIADILVARMSTPQQLLARHPGCTIVAQQEPPSECRLHHRSGGTYTARWTSSVWWSSSALAASALYACLSHFGPGWEGEVQVEAGEDLPTTLLSLRRC
ncbi:hypothetical protein AB0903_24540 [Streptomyces sp. NPDC048389]|uniref:hypothetical protein n=1 Tax=Streptomyces sp. NPDC048389 TaxID=3154622 RepID=UPI003453EA73